MIKPARQRDQIDAADRPCALARPLMRFQNGATNECRFLFDVRVEAFKDGRKWQIGTSREVSWIANGTTAGPAITAAIPPVFEAYATCYEPDGVTIEAHERALVEGLVQFTPDQSWWLGYLETGAHSVIFDQVPKVSLYWHWPYVLVAAGPEQALGWRTGHMRAQYGVLPDLFFPQDRSWLISALWDDTWTCIGGPSALIEVLEHDPLVQARRVQSDVDATPPGREREEETPTEANPTEANLRMPQWYRDT
jgi:hypothetical protein